MAEPYVVGMEEGDAYHTLNHLVTMKATAASTGGSLGLVEARGNPGEGAPPHVHHGEDEFFYMIEGTARFYTEGKAIDAGPGAFIFLPRDIPHHYELTGDTEARYLIGVVPGGFEQFFADAGERAGGRSVPPPSPPDIEKVAGLVAGYKCEILLPDS
jgi:quercetin dioxygenase-like cupin family protein